MPAVPLEKRPPWQDIQIAKDVYLPNGDMLQGTANLFHIIYGCTAGAVFASMGAYLAAQFCDVQLYHFWKKLTKGKHLWLRNNFSTLISQFVDSFMVVSITFGAAYFRGEMALDVIISLFFGNYLFKFTAALIDTGPLYLSVRYLSKYLRIPQH